MALSWFQKSWVGLLTGFLLDMQVYRLSKCEYIEDLNGTGARLYGGRWNSKGQAVLYTAGSRSLALLEALVHLPQKNFQANFCMGELFVPKDIPIKEVHAEDLPEGWNKIPPQIFLKKIGDKWLSEGKEALFKVPSVIIPKEYNFLINPLHKEAKRIRLTRSYPYVFDVRLK